jgi:glycerate kinase
MAMSALACPASLKGVLGAVEAAQWLAMGLQSAGVDAKECPLADGGEDTAEVLWLALGGEWLAASVPDPLGRLVTARYLMLPDGTAVVEAAEAIGLTRLGLEELDPWEASSLGFGELVADALAHDPRTLLVCLGGVATVDGGAGMREAIDSLPVPTRVACDVRNPLLGPRGAARVFGPQKGASPEVVDALEARLASMTELAEHAGLPGAGAAGGLGAAFAALGAELVSGAELVLDLVGFRERLRGVELAVTGEGTVDRSTFEGKAPGEALRVCREEGVRCELFGGVVAEAPAGVRPHELSGDRARAAADLVELGRRLGSDGREAGA